MGLLQRLRETFISVISSRRIAPYSAAHYLHVTISRCSGAGVLRLVVVDNITSDQSCATTATVLQTLVHDSFSYTTQSPRTTLSTADWRSIYTRAWRHNYSRPTTHNSFANCQMKPIQYKKVSCRKHIARQHSSQTFFFGQDQRRGRSCKTVLLPSL